MSSLPGELSAFERKTRIYLDHNATSPLRQRARDAVVAAMDAGGNPSSVHAEGRGARALVDAARAQVAKLVGAAARNVVFTSGATEATALALHPAVEIAGRPGLCDVLLAGAVEHPAVLRGHRFPADRLDLLPVERSGRIDPDVLDQALGRHRQAGRRALVAIQAANNESGVVQDIATLSGIVRAHDGVFFCDAVQAAGRLPLDIAGLGVDMLALSAHKLGGPLGVGALVFAHADSRAPALISGGGQEFGRRAGTENVPAIAGFGAVAAEALAGLDQEPERLAALRDALEAVILTGVPDANVIGAGTQRLPNTSFIAFAGVKAETLVIALDLAHISISAGSACASGKVGASHVLTAMGLGQEMDSGAVRLSLGWSSTAQDVDRAVEALVRAVEQMRGRVMPGSGAPSPTAGSPVTVVA